MSKNDNIDEELFLQLKNMYNKNYINPEEFKQIIIKYKDLKNQTKWSFEQEQILSEISEKSSLYHWLHRASYDYYIKQDNLFVYPLAIINGISSMFTLIGVTYEEKIDPKVLALVSGTINFNPISFITSIISNGIFFLFIESINVYKFFLYDFNLSLFNSPVFINCITLSILPSTSFTTAGLFAMRSLILSYAHAL